MARDAVKNVADEVEPACNSTQGRHSTACTPLSRSTHPLGLEHPLHSAQLTHSDFFTPLACSSRISSTSR